MDNIIVRLPKKTVRKNDNEIERWLYDNNIPSARATFIYYIDFYFNNKEDAVAFKLRWC